MILSIIIMVIVCYLVGNISGALITTKIFELEDIRHLGSGNLGTTNMARNHGIKFGSITFFIDFSKGLLCTWLSFLIMYLLFNDVALARLLAFFGGLSVIIGHIFPVFLKFKGGKGFATGIAVLGFMFPIATLICLLVALIVLLIFDRMSVCAFCFFILEVCYCWIFQTKIDVLLPIASSIILILILYAHRQNIVRLIHNEEKPLGIRKKLFNK